MSVALAVRAAAGGRAVAPLVARSRRPAACSTQPRLRCNRAGLQAVVVLLLPLLPPPGHSELVSYSTPPMPLYNPVEDLAAGQAGSVGLVSYNILPML